MGSLGKTLMGCGMVLQIRNGPDNFLTGLSIAGFILDALGGFFAHLFSADAKAVSEAIKASDERTDAKIEQATK